MFGYVTVNQDELKIREYRRYRSFYCGLCRSLQVRYGLRGQVILPNDMVFADILLNGLYEQPLAEERRLCIAHPGKKQHMVRNGITDYCADMGVLLAYYKLLDDARDNRDLRRIPSGAGARLLKKRVDRIAKAWPRQAGSVQAYIEGLTAFERSGSGTLDEVAGLTGTALGEILVMKEDLWAGYLRRMGFFLGKFVYLLDAYEDLEKDRKSGSYNPWEPYAGREDFDAMAEQALTLMMAECAREFEKLPIVQDADILRNVLYSGVWTKYRQLRDTRGKGREPGTVREREA